MVIAHRGESYIAPENSITAIKMAWDNGARAVEVDIHLTADNEIVVIHDRHTGRTGNMKLPVAESTLAELKKVDIGINKSPQFAGEKIPALSDVLSTIPEDGKLIIEIKCSTKIIPVLNKLLSDSGLKNNHIEIISFDFETICKAKEVMPQYKMLWLLNLDYYLPHWLIMVNYKKLIRKLKTNNIDGVNVWAGKVINKKFVNAFRKNDLIVYVWTVNSPIQAKKLIDYGVKGITTDRADWLTQQLNNLCE